MKQKTENHRENQDHEIDTSLARLIRKEKKKKTQLPVSRMREVTTIDIEILKGIIMKNFMPTNSATQMKWTNSLKDPKYQYSRTN